MSLLAAKLAAAQLADDIGRTAAAQSASAVQLDADDIGRTAAELLAETPEQTPWIVPGAIAPGWMVKLSGREKVGKGTLLVNLLGCVERGEPTVFGAACEPMTALIYSEEPADSMREKVAQAGLQKACIIFGYELTALNGWKAKVDFLADVVKRDGHGLFFTDNISRATGCEDEAGTELARAAEYLGEAMKRAGAAVLLDHHHRKASGKLEDKSRGGTALAGACDNNVEIERVGDWESRVRRVSSRGRLSTTIWTRQIALSEDGRNYESVADDGEPQMVDERRRLRILRDAPDGLTRAEFEAVAEISKSTAHRALEEFVVKGWATCGGSPKRYRAVEQTTPAPPI